MIRGKLIVFAMTTTFLPGCLTLFSKTEVIRSEESRRPIQFENPQAAEEFSRVVKNHDGHVGGTYLGVPFVTVYRRNRQLSENAVWNECVIKCDSNQDGLITCSEVTIFANQ